MTYRTYSQSISSQKYSLSQWEKKWKHARVTEWESLPGIAEMWYNGSRGKLFLQGVQCDIGQPQWQRQWGTRALRVGHAWSIKHNLGAKNTTVICSLMCFYYSMFISKQGCWCEIAFLYLSVIWWVSDYTHIVEKISCFFCEMHSTVSVLCEHGTVCSKTFVNVSVIHKERLRIKMALKSAETGRNSWVWGCEYDFSGVLVEYIAVSWYLGWELKHWASVLSYEVECQGLG